MENPPTEKTDEQYPLLKVEAGGGDSGRTPANTSTPGWNVTCAPKRPWIDRWPELFSACWMSGMLLGIFVLIVYGLGTLGVIRRQPVFNLNCNGTRPASEVFFHHIIQHGANVPFDRFSEYLSYLTPLYPGLHFNVLFLIDDSTQNNYRSSRRYQLLNKLIPYHRTSELKDETMKRELKDFHLKCQNVNVTTIPLDKYMSVTPLRYKWRTIPMHFLIFYVRVFSVWQNGGVGMDLDHFSNQYFNHVSDWRLSEILRQHNNGIRTEEYSKTLTKIDREEQNEYLSLFYGIVHQLLNETRAFFNRSITFAQDLTEKENKEPGSRRHRNKREITNTVIELSPMTTDKKASDAPTADISIMDSAYQNTEHGMELTNNVVLNMLDEMNSTKNMSAREFQKKMEQNPFNVTELKLSKNFTEIPRSILFYDISIFDSIGPSYVVPQVMPHIREADEQDISITTPNRLKKSPYLLSITLDGTFIAASWKQHPFLGHIISAGCQRMPPRFSIQDAILTQCSGIFTDDLYCSNIYIL